MPNPQVYSVMKRYQVTLTPLRNRMLLAHQHLPLAPSQLLSPQGEGNHRFTSQRHRLGLPVFELYTDGTTCASVPSFFHSLLFL